ncbi:hypothetical protein LAUMK35_02068 [Mycobacterium pseudokansasii]|nr:hypothetical protein LAUMK35_02068 [Mycobacterium pseudokansasii]VAZ93786.1 hypothetical protein LAUMK21_02069 [Mycobacterium pseudokansasii]
MAAGPAGAPQPGIAADATEPAIAASGRGGPAVAACAAVAIKQPAGPAATTGLAGPAGPARAAVADQPGVASGATGLAGPAGRTVAAVAVEQTTSPAGLAGCGSVGAVADQRPSEQCLGRRVDQVQRALLQGLQRRSIGGFGAGVQPRTSAQGTHELVVERRRLGAQRLIGSGVPGKQRRNGRRDLIRTGGQ